jgi:hypothetical protein
MILPLGIERLPASLKIHAAIAALRSSLCFHKGSIETVPIPLRSSGGHSAAMARMPVLPYRSTKPPVRAYRFLRDVTDVS